MTMTAQKRNDNSAAQTGAAEDYLTITIADQIFGIPVLQVQDVLGSQSVARMSLAPAEFAGALNLRGRIVTAINVRRRLGLEPRPQEEESMSVVVEHENELYSLIIDKVGDVLSLHNEHYENNPATLDQVWRDVSLGIYRLDKSLLVILDVAKLLSGVRS